MTTYVVYSFGGTIIDSFNSSTTITRQQCDDFAISHAARVSTPLQMQRVCSYTVTAGPNKSKLFQFREEDSIISMANFSLAKAVHPEFVASCEYLGTVGDSQPLHIYEMENLSGTAHVMARIPPASTVLHNQGPCKILPAALLLSAVAEIVEQVLCTMKEQRSKALHR